MKNKKRRALNLDDFGSAIGLSSLDKEVIRQRNRAIEYLKSARLKRKISQIELAKRLGTKQPAIARMESGHVGDVSFDFLVRVALALGVELALNTGKKAA